MSAPEGGVDESALRWKLQRVPSHIVDKALALYVVLTERGTPAWVRALAVAALAYLMNPLDACPDALPGIGLIDDLAVLALALDRLARHVTPTVEARVERLRPRWLAGGKAKPTKAKAGGTPDNQNQEGEPDDGPEENDDDDSDGGGSNVPFVERFRIL
jgi:uncharacterized membrane protein YkvA (DUF1232 family)